MPKTPARQRTSPSPLIAASPPALDSAREDVPVSAQFDDIYFSSDDGLAETQQVFLSACGLPQRWQDREQFCIGELGFGTGLNFLAAWSLWKHHRPSQTARLHYVSIEAYPWDAAQLETAHKNFPGLSNLSAHLREKWPGRVRGLHRIELPDGVSLTLCHDAAHLALGVLDVCADAWFLDGFTPSKNPDMWSDNLMQAVYNSSAAGCTIGTFTVAGSVRRALSGAGFTVTKTTGFGRKRHRLEAVKSRKPVNANSRPYPKIPVPIIIGAGIAGASLARSFERRGVPVTLIDPCDDSAASANPIAIVKPRLDLQDRPESRFFLSAYLYALHAYAGPAVLQRGIAQLAKSSTEARRFEKLAAQGALGPHELAYLPSEIMAEKTGLPSRFGGLWHARGHIIGPKLITDTWTKNVHKIHATVAKVIDGCALDPQGNILAKGSDIYICAGGNISKFLPQLDLRQQRGQLSYSQPSSALRAPIIYGGYAVSTPEKLILGATHGKGDENSWTGLHDIDHQRNFDGYTSQGGEASCAKGGRASMRVTTAWTLPVAGTVSPGVHVITGLGGRGFVHAPLLAEALVSQICGDPNPMDKHFLKQLAPNKITAGREGQP